MMVVMLLDLVQADKGLDDQIVECGVIGNCVPILMYSCREQFANV